MYKERKIKMQKSIKNESVKKEWKEFFKDIMISNEEALYNQITDAMSVIEFDMQPIKGTTKFVLIAKYQSANYNEMIGEFDVVKKTWETYYKPITTRAEECQGCGKESNENLDIDGYCKECNKPIHLKRKNNAASN